MSNAETRPCFDRAVSWFRISRRIAEFVRDEKARQGARSFGSRTQYLESTATAGLSSMSNRIGRTASASPFSCILTANRLETGVPVELPDGRIVPFNDSPEHCTLLAEQMGRPYPVELTPEDDASFFAALEDMERWFPDGPRERDD